MNDNNCELAVFSPTTMADLQQQFASNHVVRINGFLPSGLAAELSEEAKTLLHQSGSRRDMWLEATGDTKRAYSSVPRNDIYNYNGLIRHLFECPALQEFLAEVAGEAIHPVPYEAEQYIINSQRSTGDEHGWHFDDYTYALIWVAEAPGALEGGRVEYVNFAEWDKRAPKEQLNHLLTHREVKSLYIPAGSFYFMKARYVLHRVSPLSSNSSPRTVVVFTFANTSDLSDQTISHETMEAIYDLKKEEAR